MKKSILKLTISIAALAAATAVTQGQTNQTTAAAPAPAGPGPIEQAIQDIKNPVPWLTWGGELRLRNEYLDNAIRLSDGVSLHEQDYFRFRGRLWAAVTPVTNLTLNTRFAAEPRVWMKPATSNPMSPKPYEEDTARTGVEWRYGIVDNLNLQWNNILEQPLSITGGRQDILLGDPGDAWLVCDGTPNDGSWTFFLDSVRATFDAKAINTKIDLIYIYQNARPGDWIPTFGSSRNYYLTEQNEQGAILYLSNKSLKNVQLDGYFIYKGDDKEMSNGDSGDIYTIGGKITGTPAEHWFYSAEGAYQFGWKTDKIMDVVADRTIDAFAGKVKLSYLFKDKLNNQVSFIGEFLSGDNPNTKGKDEMFDVLWGRYPRWSEMAPFYYAPETSGRMAQMNNLGRVGASWSVTPIKDTTFTAVYNALLAPQEVPTRTVSPAQFSNAGNFRGHYVQLVLRHQFNKHMSAYVMGEGLWEGDYYAQRSVMTFVRSEVTFTF